jgi:DNA-binding NarL/FixJ family response regulator
LVPKTPILVFSQHAEAIYATKALEAGARGFVSKNAMPEEFLEAIDSVLAGAITVEKSVQHDMAMRDLAEDAYLKPLTERDLEILRLLAAGNSLSEIAARLGIAYKTVANTLSRIKEKLGVGQTSDLIRIAVGRGLTDLA